MKHLKKIFAAAMALFMALAVVTPAFAANVTSGTITINPPENATGTNTYKVYKVFDATVGANNEVAYKLLDGVTDAPTGWTVQNGYITEAPATLDATAIEYLKNYTGKVLVATVETEGTTPASVENLDAGYYFVETSTGTAVWVDYGDKVTVDDKNVISTVVKSAGTQYDADSLKAIAAVGTDQAFTAVITKGKGAINMVFADTMTDMTFNADSLTITAEPAITANDYTLTVAEDGKSFTVAFENAYIAQVADNSSITLGYTGKIMSSALHTKPATNKATVTTGDNANNTSTTEEVDVYNARVTVNKVDGDGAPLAGAKFKLKNSAGLYYAGASTENAATANWTTEGIEVEAVAVSDEEGNLVSYTAEFVGLGEGTYTLEESTVPGGYNKANDQTITVALDDLTSVNQVTSVTNQSGATLPSTGGIGTTLFYVIGGLMVAGAAIALVVKNRVAKIEK